MSPTMADFCRGFHADVHARCFRADVHARCTSSRFMSSLYSASAAWHRFHSTSQRHSLLANLDEVSTINRDATKALATLLNLLHVSPRLSTSSQGYILLTIEVLTTHDKQNTCRHIDIAARTARRKASLLVLWHLALLVLVAGVLRRHLGGKHAGCDCVDADLEAASLDFSREHLVQVYWETVIVSSMHSVWLQRLGLDRSGFYVPIAPFEAL